MLNHLESNNKPTRNLSLTAILVKDEDGGFSAYLAEFPEAVAEGETEDDAMSNLFDAFTTILTYRREVEEEDRMTPPQHQVFTHSMNFALA